MKTLLSTSSVLLTSLALTAATLTGCTPALSYTQRPTPRALPSDLQVGRLAERTTFEQTDASGERIDTSDDLSDGSDTDRDQRRRKGAFVGGVVASALGGAMAIGFGAAGQITENQLDDGYNEGLSRNEESDLRDRGKAFNGVAIGGAALAVAGLALTAIVLGIDHRKCGELIKSRRKECLEAAAH
ncbi:MAG: hypothetical protein ACRBN8_07535 [Nannocystales bacterium]